MDKEKQNEFLIDMLRVMIRDLLVYRTFEKEKQDVSQLRQQEIEAYLTLVRNDAGVRTQLGPDFVVFVTAALEGEEKDAAVLLDQFLRQWTPQVCPN